MRQTPAIHAATMEYVHIIEMSPYAQSEYIPLP